MCLAICQRFFDDVFRDDDLLLVDERLDDVRLRDPDDLRDPEDFRDGTLAPLLRASLSPIAIACLRLLTFRPEPLFSVPRFRRRIVDSTFFEADLPYFAIRRPPPQRTACKCMTRGRDATCRRSHR
jgi:hypothetical protein